MKKLAFLLALVAVLAMSASAFAKDGDIIKLRRYNEAFNDTNSYEAPGEIGDGNYAAEVFYYGNVDSLIIGSSISMDKNTSYDTHDTTVAKIDGYDHLIYRMAAPAYGSSQAGKDLQTRYEIPFELFPPEGVSMDIEFGLYKLGEPEGGFSGGRVTKTFTAVRRELRVTMLDDQSGEDVKDKPINVGVGVPVSYDITIAGKAGLQALSTDRLGVRSGDAYASDDLGPVWWESSKGKLHIRPVSATAGNQLVVTVGTVPEGYYYIGGRRGIWYPGRILDLAYLPQATQVAGVDENTVFGTITINFVDFGTTPSYAIWQIGKSDDETIDVNFKAEVSSDKFLRINDGTTDLIAKADISGTSGTKNGVSVTKNGDDITVGIAKAFFESKAATFTPKEDGSVNGSITLKIFGEGSGGDEEIGAFTILFKKDADKPTPPPTPPAKPEEPVTQLIAKPENAKASRMITETLRTNPASKDFLLTFGEDGDTIQSVNGKDDDGKETIPELKGERKLPMRMAFLSLDDEGNITSADAPDYINIVIDSLAGSDNTEFFDVTDSAENPLPNETVSVDKEDGCTATFSVGNKPVDGAWGGFYTIKVYEGAKQPQLGDLAAKKDGDLLAEQKLMISESTSGGACDMGFGLAAVAALAALAIMKRSKK